MPHEWYTVSNNMAYMMSEQPSIPFKRGQQNHLAKLWAPPWAEILAVSMDCEDDEYDHLGRNVSAQERRQELFPWFTVVRSREEVRTDEQN